MHTGDVYDLDAVLRTLGTHLAILRNRQQRSLKQAAAQMRQQGLKISASTLGMYEGGRRGISTRRLLELATFYQVGASWLLRQAIHCTGTDPLCPLCGRRS